jgi:hypothetical protein
MNRIGESWEEYRKRMLDETSRFIEWGLRHPELVTWIPTKLAGDGGFPHRVAEWYWGTVLSDRIDGAVARWRGWLHRASSLVKRR